MRLNNLLDYFTTNGFIYTGACIYLYAFLCFNSSNSHDKKTPLDSR